MAARGWPGAWMLLGVFVGGYMSAGAANAINMVIDRDIDGTMKRTASRPTVTQSIPSRDALLFSFALAAGSFGILWAVANLLTAMLALAGLVFYVIVYTMVLKRRTWQNIVIGGAAGAVPVLVGWAAVTDRLSWAPLVLFAVVFLWTPPHFWALAVRYREDYEAAHVPMLPVVAPFVRTARQILVYSLALVAVTLVFTPVAHMGWLYSASAGVLGVVLVGYAVRLRLAQTPAAAMALFGYSITYLTLLFVAMAADVLVRHH